MAKSKIGKKIDKILDGDVFLIFPLIAGLILGLILPITCLDIKPATEKDYDPLLKIQSSIIQNFDNVYNYADADISISNSNIEVNVENDQCGLKMIFDKNTNYLYSERFDKNLPSAILIFLGVASCMACILVCVFLSIAILVALQSFFEWIYKVSENKEKTKKEKVPYDNITHGGDIDP